MPPRLRPADPFEVNDALARFGGDEATSADLRLLCKHYLALLSVIAPGRSVEVRIPPYAAAQVVAGVRHTRGTPPAVVEMTPTLWIRLAIGQITWAQATQSPEFTASGERADLSAYLPIR
ncbi:sterol carrier family protein [Nocardioides limicola]|uniref:sterol carrier family protein n=1 Tax=Nocardioides limicola TaxID=2803368 RepID=UPI0027DBE029|nr:sterol carrier family protein [Nocardioides sp. DJM-14]